MSSSPSEGSGASSSLYSTHPCGSTCCCVYTCSECTDRADRHWRCTDCQDYGLCVSCYHTKSHNHPMEKRGLSLDDDSSNQQAAATQSPGDSRRLSIQHCIQSLIHACQCRNANCSLPSCQKMKQAVQHTKGCKGKTNGGCPSCKQLIALCCYHAKHCQNKCPVPFCLDLKQKLLQQQLQQQAPAGPDATQEDGQHAAHWCGGAATGPALPNCCHSNHTDGPTASNPADAPAHPFH